MDQFDTVNNRRQTNAAAFVCLLLFTVSFFRLHEKREELGKIMEIFED